MSKLKVNQLETLDGAKLVNVADIPAAADLAAKFDKTGGDINGDVNFIGTARRIRGDFSNATVASRTLFQTSTANGSTVITAVPNGTSTGAYAAFLNSSDPANAAYCYVGATATSFRFDATAIGSGTLLPITFHTSNQERLRIATNGNIGLGTSDPKAVLHSFNASNFGNPDPTGVGTTGVSARIQGGSANIDFGVYSSGNTWIQSRLNTDNAVNFQLVLNPVGGSVLIGKGGFGFADGVGVGGSVTQATSKSTAVTLNKPCGQITTHGAEMLAGAVALFDCLNSEAIGTCTAVATISTATPNYWDYRVEAVAAGGGRITFRLTNVAAVSRTAQVIFNFVLLKGATS